MNPGGSEGDDVYDVNDVYTDYTILGETHGFEPDDVYGVNDDDTEYTNQRNPVASRQSMCTV